VHDLIADDRSGDLDYAVGAKRVQDRFGGRSFVTLDEGDGGWTFEQDAESFSPGLPRGDLHQPVLDDVVRDVLLAQASTDRAELGDLEAAVFGDDHGRAGPSFLGQLCHGLPLGLCSHWYLPESLAAARRSVGFSAPD